LVTGAIIAAALIPPALDLAGHRAASPALPLILCSGAPDPSRPASQTTVLQSEPLAGDPNRRMTTILVRYPPGGYTPAHVHGGDLTVYVVKGEVRSEHAGLPPGDFRAGQVFYEPQGTTHVFIENKSATEWAELIAVMVHDDGAPLTTFLAQP
jgi:quercetin dioxygenase-like cupin family protein